MLVEATTIADLLKANIGKKVKIYFADKPDTNIEAKLLKVTEEQRNMPPNPYAPEESLAKNIPVTMEYGIWCFWARTRGR